RRDPVAHPLGRELARPEEGAGVARSVRDAAIAAQDLAARTPGGRGRQTEDEEKAAAPARTETDDAVAPEHLPQDSPKRRRPHPAWPDGVARAVPRGLDPPTATPRTRRR